MNFSNDTLRGKIMATDGKLFDNEIEAMIYDDKISRKAFYDYLVERRNWIQKLLNVKPNMSMYDRLSFNSKFK